MIALLQTLFGGKHITPINKNYIEYNLLSNYKLIKKGGKYGC